LLEKSIRFGGPLRLSQHRRETGEAMLEQACAEGWEGIIAKRADSPYVEGRSAHWLKMKCSMRQEFVVGGFTDPKGTRLGFGALLVGTYRDGRLLYAGMVGSGYTYELLQKLWRQLEAIETRDSPFDAGKPPRKGAHW